MTTTLTRTDSIFRTALGADFDRLHPELQRRFGFSSADGVACVGEGVMEEIWRGSVFAVPFLRLGAARNILFPETGRNVPFVIENYAYLDDFGRDTVTFTRTFELGNGLRRRFDATMVHSARRGCVVDYLGTHQHVAVDLDLSVDSRGGLLIRSGEQRLREGLLDLRVPRALLAHAEVREWYDEQAAEFRIEVRVSSRWAGPLFGYRGRFTARYWDTAAARVPATVRPYREELRD
ncbi:MULTISPECIES: DUF4166 domain-containing protein [unclassified Crossiella]|uniref:DUF4166 domain-containing protein n=1 Tax=unclassified Crossiella TaxID=2620835 RepID=UPI001FFFB700|nr:MULTISPECIES: DUF4166 domain-containing protein [unclassified Crossiella]MCK2241250.1 DUF4166 domain-containing protein [Crossiella sp. S99.2]MCK2253606.1 DUF4166 domain-containing protein [Crossiella sp. S99.1]